MSDMLPSVRRRFELQQAWTEGQLDGERSRLVLEGRRVDDGSLCTLVVVHEISGDWVLYPHGWGKFGVRVAKAEAVTMAQTIIDGA